MEAEKLDRGCECDPFKQVMVNTLELVEQAKEIAYEDDTLFNCMFDMVLDYQRTCFEQLKSR